MDSAMKRPVPSNLNPWKPGQSGNVHGGSKVVREFRAEIRKRSANGAEMLDYLFEQLRDPKAHEMIRFKCAEMLVQYAIGKPVDVPEPDGKGLDFGSLTEHEIAVLQSIHGKLRGAGGHDPLSPALPDATVRPAPADASAESVSKPPE